MNPFHPSLTLLVILLTSVSWTIRADDRVQASLSLADEVIIPAYQAFEKTAARFSHMADSHCRVGNTVDVAGLQKAFHPLMDAWQRLQWLRQGPAEFSFRHQRIQYWPDKHGSGGRQFRKLMNNPDPAVLEPDRFRDGSVALQGLPALERLLFIDTVDPSDFVAEDGTVSFRCRYLSAIGANLSVISGNLVRDYSGVYRDALVDPGPDNPFFESSGVSVSHYLSQLATQLEFIAGAKLADPLGFGEGASRVRLKQLESWRSKRSLRNLRINLDSLARVSDRLLGDLLEDPGTIGTLAGHWQSVRDALTGLPDGVSGADGEIAQLQRLHDSLVALHGFIAGEVTMAIGVPLGFNSLDGD